MWTMPSRRDVLQSSLVVVGGVLFAGCGPRTEAPVWPPPPPFLTPQSAFYNRLDAKLQEGKFVKADDVPVGPKPPKRSEWRLTFKGFETARDLDAEALADLAAKHKPISFLKTLRCTGDGRGNRLASTGLWTGIPLLSVLHEMGLPEATRRLRITAWDRFTCNLQSRFTAGMDGRPALLATHLNGDPLMRDRGGPCRLLIPDRYGFKNIKWPVQIEATPEDEAWGDHEVDKKEGEDDGLVRMGSKILSPDVLYKREVVEGPAGAVRLQGVAFGGLAPVAKVQIRLDEGPWQDAELLRPPEVDSPLVQRAPGLIFQSWPLPDVAVPWRMDLELPKGTTRVDVMATNTLDEAQPAEDTWRRDGDSSWAWVELRLT